MMAGMLFMGYTTATPGGGGGGNDPHWANVVLQLGNESGAHGTATFVDQSASGHTPTVAGSVTWTNASAPAGLSTAITMAGGNPSLRIADHADLEMGSGDFALDLYWKAAQLATNRCVIHKRSGNDFYAFFDGVPVSTWSSAASLWDNTGGLWLGTFPDNTFDGLSFWAAVRLTKGVARHTSAFTPPALPLPTS